MTIKRTIRTEIRRHTFERIVVQSPVKAVRIWCKKCHAEVLMFPPEFIAVMQKTSIRAVYRKIENNSLHFIEMDNGEVLVCQNKLPSKFT